MKYIICLFLLLQLTSRANNFPTKPTNYITDEANVISDTDELLLNKKLHSFQDSTSSQIFVYIANSLEGADIVQVSHDIFDKWDIGQKGKNNGVLITIFIKDHKFRIHTGYGMEGILPDVLTKRIQDEEMRPSFKQNNYYGGINNGVDKLIYYSKNEYKAQNYQANKEEEEDSYVGYILVYIFTGILYFLFYLIMRSSFKENRSFKITFLIIAAVIGMIPGIGLFFVALLLIIFAIVAAIRKVSKNVSSGTWTSSGSSFYSGSSWGSSSDSSSSWSSSDSSSDFGGGGGGDSGGGGSSSDW